MAINNLAKLAESLGLHYLPKGNVMYGDYKGYSVAAQFDNDRRTYIITASAKPSSEYSTANPGNMIQDLTSQSKAIKAVLLNGYGIEVVTLPSSFSNKTSMTNIATALNILTDYLSQNMFTNCCNKCGIENSSSLYSVNTSLNYLCDNCHNDTIGTLEMNKQAIKLKKGNMITGIVGAFLGALLGSVIWILIAQLGYISAIGGIAIAVCAFKGYEMFGGKLNVTGIIICCVIVIATIYFATHMSYAIEVYNVFSEMYGMSFFDSFRIVPEMIKEEPELMAAFIGDLVIGYVLSLIVVIPSAISTAKTKSGVYNIGKIG